MTDEELEGWKGVVTVTRFYNDIRFDVDYNEDQTGVVFNACLSEYLD